MENPHLFTPYTILKARILDAHQLTDYQKVDSLLKMELLAAMLEACPTGLGDKHLLHPPLPLLAAS